MNAEDKRLADAALRRVFVGRVIWGLTFFIPALLFDEPPDSPSAGPLNGRNGKAWLHIESRWQIFGSLPSALPGNEDELEERPVEELSSEVCKLRFQKIVGAELGNECPHLVLTFEDGRVLFVNGHHDSYECWQVYAGDFTVVAMMGDDVAVWTPDGFSAA